MDSAPTTGAKVLLAAAEAERRAVLAKALLDAGYEVAVAPSGSFALTMLEWERPDVIVSGAGVQDMDGEELFTLVRKDPATMHIPFLLLGGADRPDALDPANAGADITILGADVTMEEVVARVRDLLRRGAHRRVANGDRVETTGGRRSLQELWETIAASESAETASGSLGPVDATEIVQAIAFGGKTGCLVVSVTAGRGTVLFENGRVAHASFRGLSGEPAFAAVISAAKGEAQARFCFSRADGAQVTHLPRTISRSVDQLLVSIAAGNTVVDTSWVQGSPTPTSGEDD